MVIERSCAFHLSLTQRLRVLIPGCEGTQKAMPLKVNMDSNVCHNLDDLTTEQQ